jgi:hypothetical protein
MPIWGITAGAATMLISGLGVGAFNGLAVAWFEMTPFVVTLASMIVIGGATVWMTNSQSLSDFPDRFFDIFLSAPAGVPGRFSSSRWSRQSPLDPKFDRLRPLALRCRTQRQGGWPGTRAGQLDRAN